MSTIAIIGHCHRYGRLDHILALLHAAGIPAIEEPEVKAPEASMVFISRHDADFDIRSDLRLHNRRDWELPQRRGWKHKTRGNRRK